MGKKVINEIDQSGKIEKTSKDTVLALSNDSWDAVIIKAKTKRQVQEIFRRNGQTSEEKKLPEIHFGLIGKLSPAHDIAAKITHKKQKVKYEINLGEILTLIKKTEVGKRLKNA